MTKKIPKSYVKSTVEKNKKYWVKDVWNFIQLLLTWIHFFIIAYGLFGIIQHYRGKIILVPFMFYGLMVITGYHVIKELFWLYICAKGDVPYLKNTYYRLTEM